MPELPDVEAILRCVRATSLHKRIVSVKVFDSRIVKGGHVRSLKDSLIGRSFKSTKRRGKFIIVKTDSPYYVVFHFGMTGDVRYFKNGDMPEYTRALFSFHSGYHLAYISQRMLGGIWLTRISRGTAKHCLNGP